MEYTFLPVEVGPEKIKQYADLLSAVFPATDKFTEAYIHWQYSENPCGKAVGFDAYSGDELAAHYVALPVVYVIDGIKTKGLLSLNTATSSKHQGKGLFTKLASLTYDHAAANGYRFVIGVANQNSTHGFLKKLGFYLVAPLDVKLGVGALNLRNNESAYQLFSFWDEAILNWRLANPQAEYYKKNQSIFARADKKGIYALLGQTSLPLAKVASKKFTGIKLWIGLAEKRSSGGLFFTLPDKLKPSPLNLIFKDLSGKLPVLTAQKVYFELLDFDAY